MKNEIKRYLGCANVDDDNLDKLIDTAIEQIESAKNVKIMSEIFDISTDENGVFCDEIYFRSKSLSKHLKTCKRAALVCITLGVEVDRLIDRTAIENIALAAVMQSTAAAIIEHELDLREKAICENHPTVMRFSAGYGDFDIAYQSDFLRILKAYTIGVSLTESQQLVPTKTVTAIIGIKE